MTGMMDLFFKSINLCEYLIENNFDPRSPSALKNGLDPIPPSKLHKTPEAYCQTKTKRTQNTKLQNNNTERSFTS